METLSAREVEVKDRKGHWYNLQIRPYETADNKITGAVMILFDINTAKLDAEKRKMLANYAEAFVGTVRSATVVLNGKLQVEKATPYFYDAFRLVPKETEGFSVFEIGNGQWNFPEFHSLLEERVPRQPRVKDFALEHEFTGLGRRQLRLNVRRVQASNPEDTLTIISIGEAV